MEVLAHHGHVDHLHYSHERNTLFSTCEKTRRVILWDHLTMDIEGVLNQATLKQDKKWVRTKNSGLEKKQEDLELMKSIL